VPGPARKGPVGSVLLDIVEGQRGIRRAFRLFSRVGDMLVGSIEGRSSRRRGKCTL